jgi:hypothetical protein
MIIPFLRWRDSTLENPVKGEHQVNLVVPLR